MNSYICAISSDDGINYTDRHFGDAKCYILYEITSASGEFVKIITNTSEHDKEDIHADPQKAGSVVSMLKKEKVQIVASGVFGPNIKRIKSKFVCLLMDQGSISNSIPNIINNYIAIAEEWNKGEERSFLNLKKS